MRQRQPGRADPLARHQSQRHLPLAQEREGSGDGRKADVHQWHYERLLLRDAGLGHEFVGEIVALGEGVTTDYAGSRSRSGTGSYPSTT